MHALKITCVGVGTQLKQMSALGLMLPIWTRQDVETRILAGEFLVIRHGHVHRIPQQWLAAHPGGALAILHFVGRDASEEIDAYHSERTLQRMKHYVIARVELPWVPFLPPVMSGWVRRTGPEGNQTWFREASAVNLSDSQILLVKSEGSNTNAPSPSAIQPPPATLSQVLQQQHITAYRALHDRIKQAGLYDTPFISGYGPEILRYALFAAIAAAAYSFSYFFISAVSLGLLWHQLSFTAHDLGHCGVTHDWFWDRLLGIFVANLLGGISIGWWVDVSLFHTTVSLPGLNGFL